MTEDTFIKVPCRDAVDYLTSIQLKKGFNKAYLQNFPALIQFINTKFNPLLAKQKLIDDEGNIPEMVSSLLKDIDLELQNNSSFDDVLVLTRLRHVIVLSEWINNYIGDGGNQTKMVICDSIKYHDKSYFNIYDRDNIYTISLHIRKNSKAYLGCIAGCRYAMAGEYHIRGADLPDGDFTEETFANIMKRILSRNIVNIEDSVINEAGKTCL